MFLVPPRIILQVIDVTRNETSNAEFICQAIGEPFPNIRWYFNGNMIDLSDSSKYSSLSVVINYLDGTTISFLVIINALSSDVGTYTCEAENVIGSDQTHGILTVNGMYDCVNVLMSYVSAHVDN